MSQIFLASEALFIVTCYVVKSSVLSTVERILGPDMRIQRIVCWVLHGVIGIAALGSLLAVVVSCSGGQMLTSKVHTTCSNQVEYEITSP